MDNYTDETDRDERRGSRHRYDADTRRRYSRDRDRRYYERRWMGYGRPASGYDWNQIDMDAEEFERLDRQGRSHPNYRPGPYVGQSPRNYQRSDESIYDDVCEHLTWDGAVDASNVDVQIENGEITLEGTVPSRRQKRLIEDNLDRVRGVQDIHNRLTIEKNAESQKERATDY